MKTSIIIPSLLLLLSGPTVDLFEGNTKHEVRSHRNTAKLRTVPIVDQAKLTPVAKKLFRGVHSKLSVSDKNKAAAASEFVISKSDKNLFTFKGEEDAPFHVDVTITDLNDDGVEEILFHWGNSFWSGFTGTSCTLLVKNPKTGNYETNLGFPGIAEILKSKTNGYRDLLIGGPGFEFPLYKWDGKKYELKGTVKQ